MLGVKNYKASDYNGASLSTPGSPQLTFEPQLRGRLSSDGMHPCGTRAKRPFQNAPGWEVWPLIGPLINANMQRGGKSMGAGFVLKVCMYWRFARRINELSLNTARTRYDTPEGVQREIVAPQLGRIGSGLLFGGARPLALGINLGRVSGLLMPDGVHFAQHRPTKWNHRARVSKV